MSRDQRQAAVTDLLEYCRDPGHKLTIGLILTTDLLGQPSVDDYADAHLAVALEQLLAAELERWRKKIGSQAFSMIELNSSEDQVRQDLKTGNSRLELLSLISAYYIDVLGKKQLADVYALSTRSIELKLEQGRALVLELIARKRVLTLR